VEVENPQEYFQIPACQKGFIRLHKASYWGFHREYFNPWDLDNRALLEQWKNMLEPESAAA